MQDPSAGACSTFLARGAFEDADGCACQMVDARGIKRAAVFFSLQRLQQRTTDTAGPVGPEGISWNSLQSRKQHLEQFGVRIGHEGVAPPERFELSNTRFEVCYSIH